MHSLLLTGDGRPGSVAGVVEWFGAVQAHDIDQAVWALGIRLPGSTLDGIGAALERGEAVRTWAFRGSRQYVPAADVRWMLALTGVRALTGSRRPEKLGLTAGSAGRALDALPELLAGRRLTVEECQAELAARGIVARGWDVSDLLWWAGVRGLVCCAPQTAAPGRYMLLDEVPTHDNEPEPDEALATVATRYFRSHGPATVDDFARWTGLTKADAKRAVTIADPRLTPVVVDGTAMLADPSLLTVDPAAASTAWVALPGLDEYVTAYKERDMLVHPEWLEVTTPSTNGARSSLLVRGGRIAGVWKRARRGDRMTLDVTMLEPLGPADHGPACEALDRVAAFHGTTGRVKWSQF